MPFPPTFDRAWDETFPPDTQPANLLGQDIRNFKTDIRERLALISGTFVNRPSNMDAVFGGAANGILYFSTDTGRIYQWNGSSWTDITANFLASNGAVLPYPESVVANINNSFTATDSARTLYTPGPTQAGMYRYQAYAVVTAVTGSGVNTSLAFTYTDDQGAHTTTAITQIVSTLGLPFIPSVDIATPAGPNTAALQFQFYSVANQPISRTFAITPNGGGTATISIRERLTFLG